VEPPIEDAQAKVILKAVHVPKVLFFEMHYHQNQEQVDDSPSFTEFWIDVGGSLDTRGSEKVNRATVDIAHQIAQVLELQGDRIVVVDHIIPTDFQTPIFGRKAHEMHEIHEHFRSLRENTQ